MIEEQKRPVEKAAVLMEDRFGDVRRAGMVIGSQSSDGTVRHGADVEGVLSIDHDALRIEPLIESGWGRAGICYGPYSRKNGLTFGVFMLNGHNAAQNEPLGETLKRRLLRWVLGNLSSQDHKTTLLKRLARWPFGVHKRRIARRWRWWRRLSAGNPELAENLAVGWFPHENSDLPQGNSLMMHALVPESGELWASVGTTPLPTIRGVQNLQMLYVIVLRERGAAYYAASQQGAFALSAHPQLRPLAIDPFRDDDPVDAGIYQSVMGQIGFRVDTRVYGARVADIAALAAWYGTAHAADSLTGLTPVADSEAEIGGRWQVVQGSFTRTANGALGQAERSLALLTPEAPSGLIHALFQLLPEAKGSAALIWRVQDADHHWALTLSDEGCTVSIVNEGKATEIAASGEARLHEGSAQSIQILDDGQTFSLSLDGKLLFGKRFEDARFGSAQGVGLGANAGAVAIRQFEAHPRTVNIPEMSDLGCPWNPQGRKTMIREQFEGTARTLDGKAVTLGDGNWMRSFGYGSIDLSGDATAKVRASAETPNPGRTAYTVGWTEADFADLQVEITAPGSAPEQGEKGRAGLIFWQDAENYLVVSTYLDDHNPGTSISSFFHLNGFEEIYDAVWTLIPRHIVWGQAYRLRVVFDGVRYLAYVNDEAVLYRALTDVYPEFQRLTIRRVGLVVNWEWGDDTGSTFRNFIAKADHD